MDNEFHGLESSEDCAGQGQRPPRTIEQLWRRIHEFFAEWRDVAQIKKLLHEIKHNQLELKKLMSELDSRLAAIETKLDEASTEILEELGKLRNENLTEEGKATLARLETKATALADIIPTPAT